MNSAIGLNVGLIIAIPWLCALIVTRFVTVYADRTGRHQGPASAMLPMAAVGIALSVVSSSPVLVILAFCIALINSVGNLGGFVAPDLKAFAEKAAGIPSAGMFALATVALCGAGFVLLLQRTKPVVATPQVASPVSF